jgi:hypothetical protein
MTFRHRRIAAVLAVLAACALGISGSAPAPAPDAKAPTAPPESPVSRLFVPRPYDGFTDPKTTLGEALDALGNTYGVTFEVNESAFKDEGVEDVRATLVAEKPIPKAAAASLDRVLRKVLARVKAQSGAVYLVRGDHIEVTTGRMQRSEVWGRYNGPFLPLVHADFEGRPLADALRDLAEQAGFSVVVDARAADKAKAPVSASFTNLPLDTAVRLLADMAGLRTALNDNVLYVSTEERALNAGASPAPGPRGLFLAARGVAFDKRPLDEALQELLRPTGMKLVVDTAHAGQKSKVPVSAALDGTTVEAALRLLADMADLRPVIYENVVYLTTKDNAAGFIKAGQPEGNNPVGYGVMGGVGVGGLGGFGGLVGGIPGVPSAPR